MPQPTRRSAFTLIEVMTAIIIISILVALLIPAVSKIRESAATTKCASNLRQIGSAILLYANDHNDAIVPLGWKDPTSLGGGALEENYATILTRNPGRAYLDAPNAFDVKGNRPHSPSDPIPGNSVFECPSANNAAREYWTQRSTSDQFNPTVGGVTPVIWEIRTYYGMNGTLGGTQREVDKFPARALPVRVGGVSMFELRSLSSIPTPSKTVLLFDGAGHPAFSTGPAAQTKLLVNGPHQRRNKGDRFTGRTNILFFDNHVDTFARSELPKEEDIQDHSTPIANHPLADQKYANARFRLDIESN